MALVANGVKIMGAGYEWGVDNGSTVFPFQDYDQAKDFASHYEWPMKMRAVYLSDWMDAK